VDSERCIEVTYDDVQAAKSAWLAADDGDAPVVRVEHLRQDHEQLVWALDQQIVDDLGVGE